MAEFDRPKARAETIAGLRAHDVLATLGIRVPSGISVHTDVRRRGLFHIGADKVSVSPGVKLHEHAGVV